MKEKGYNSTYQTGVGATTTNTAELIRVTNLRITILSEQGIPETLPC
jgi:hypothetical protein